MIAALSLLFVAAACGDKKDDADKSAGTETEKPATDKPTDKTTTKPADKPVEDKAGVAASDDDKSLCESRCQLLTRYSLAELEAGKHKEICGTEMRTSKCQHFDYLRNCIYAHSGYKFKKKKWQKVFGKADWYKQRDDFKDSDLSKMQLSNVRELKDRAAACRSKGFTKVSAEHGKMIR